jgi:hypothetical protein
VAQVLEHPPSQHKALSSIPTTKNIIVKILKFYAVLQAWCYTPVIPALGRQRQKELKLKANLDYIGRPYRKKKKKKERNL